MAIAGVLSVWLLWILGSLELTVVSLETLVGVIVALLGILVTVILGWQIVNALELRGKIIEMEQIIKITLCQRQVCKTFQTGSQIAPVHYERI